MSVVEGGLPPVRPRQPVADGDEERTHAADQRRSGPEPGADMSGQRGSGHTLHSELVRHVVLPARYELRRQSRVQAHVGTLPDSLDSIKNI
jgi:hypothetical protein